MPHITSLSHIVTHPFYLLNTSIIILFLGPLITALFGKATFIRDMIDGFTMIMMVLLVGMHILPHTIDDIGFWAIIILLIGMFLPSLFERVHKHIASKIHRMAIFVIMIGLALHAFIDGVALVDPVSIHSVDTTHAHSMLPLAVILHRLPVGLAIWMLLTPLVGKRRTLTMLLIMGLATAAGFSSGKWIVTMIEHQPFGYFEALVAGLLLHVLFHRHDPFTQPIHDHDHHHEAHACHCHPQPVSPKIDIKWASGIGAVLAFLLIILIQNPFAGQGHAHTESSIFWNLTLASAPALVIAYLCSGLINAFLPQSSVIWMQKGNKVKRAVRGLLFGLPLPVCSCGVIPLYRSLVQRGIPLSAGITFFIATPELGLDAILITIPLLGTQFTLIRLLAAAIVALFVGIMIGVLFSKSADENKPPVENILPVDNTPAWQKLKTGMWIGLADMVDHTAPWILFGLVIAAAVQPYLETSLLLFSIPKNLQVPLFALLGLPVYVCASGITPFVAVLIYNGISPGAAIAFMLTGPATNITTFGILTQLHGRKLAITFASLIMFAAVGLGYLINTVDVFIPQNTLLTHDAIHQPYRTFFLVLLIGIFSFSLLRCGPQAWAKKIISDDVPHDETSDHSCCD